MSYDFPVADPRAVDKAKAWDELAKKNAEIERLRHALGLLRLAVDREGWPAGWGTIRKLVYEALRLNH